MSWLFAKSGPRAGADFYIDLGTSNTLIASPELGLVLNEPSLIAYSELSPGRKKVVGVGNGAKEKMARTPGNLSLSRPLRQGVIADFDTTETMLKYFLHRVSKRGLWQRLRLLLSLPFGVTEVEKKAVIEAGKKAGAREVLLVDEPMTAAIGAGLDVAAPRGSMIVDLGGGTTEVAVLALCDTVFCQTIRVGGITLDESIQSYLIRNRGLIVNDHTAEQIKIRLGTAVPKKHIHSEQVSGRDSTSGLPRSIELSSTEVGEALDDGLREIISTIHAAIEGTPPELVADIIDSGLVLSGGGALIRDLDLRLQNEIRLPTRLAENPLTSIARGGEILLKNESLLERLRLEI